MQYSDYQLAIFDAIANTTNNLAVNAVAGSGKTTTLLASLDYIPDNKKVIYTAFNKSIANTINQKLQSKSKSNAIALNIHKIALNICRQYIPNNIKIDVKGEKYSNLIKQWMSESGLTFSEPDSIKYADKEKEIPYPTEYEFYISCKKLHQLCQLNLVDCSNTEEIEAIKELYGLDFEPYNDLIPILLELLYREGSYLALQKGIIDFNDMLWLVGKYGWTSKDKYNFVFVDECQDLSKAQTAVILAISHRFTRYITCGDPRQAIYGFAGANCDSFWQLKETLNAVEFPLSVCYRCGANIVNEATELVPQIEYSLSNAIGKVDNISESKLIEAIAIGDCVLSRKTSPLISLAFQLIANKKPAYVAGRNIGESLITFLNKVLKSKSTGKRKPNFKDFPTVLNDYTNAVSEKLKSESAKQTVLDQKQCLEMIYDNCKSYNDMQFFVDDLFSDTDSNLGRIELSTIHRAKGNEWKKVYLLDESLPMTYPNQLPWQYEQELNLKYVAITRAMLELNWVFE